MGYRGQGHEEQDCAAAACRDLRPLRKWLTPYRQLSGPVRPKHMTYRRRFAEAVKASGIEKWPPNALRHSRILAPLAIPSPCVTPHRRNVGATTSKPMHGAFNTLP